MKPPLGISGQTSSRRWGATFVAILSFVAFLPRVVLCKKPVIFPEPRKLIPSVKFLHHPTGALEYRTPVAHQTQPQNPPRTAIYANATKCREPQGQSAEDICLTAGDDDDDV